MHAFRTGIRSAVHPSKRYDTRYVDSAFAVIKRVNLKGNDRFINRALVVHGLDVGRSIAILVGRHAKNPFVTFKACLLIDIEEAERRYAGRRYIVNQAHFICDHLAQ